jgi:hypothetical protein
MAEPASFDNRTLYRRTLFTAGAMVGACVVFIGTLTLVAWGVVGHAVAVDNEAQGDAGVGAPAGSARSQRAMTPSPIPSSSAGKVPK